MTAEELVETHLAVGPEHHEAGRLEEALAEWRLALEADPLDADAHYDIGLALYDSGRSGDAADHWREAIRLRPDFFEPRFHLVCSLWKRRDSGGDAWREARLLCRSALALDAATGDQRAYLLRSLAVAEWNLGERLRAIDTMRASVAAAPDLWSYERLSEMQARTGQWRASLRTFYEMAELPDYDASRFERCCDRLRLVGVALLLLGGASLAWRLTRRR